MVTHSLMVTLSPISTVVSSPLYFKSCGVAAITEPGNILQFFPILAPSIMVTFGPIHVPCPIVTLPSIVVNGSITTFFAILALGCIYAKGCFIYLTLVI